MLSGIPRAHSASFERNIRASLKSGDAQGLKEIRDEMLKQYPERKKTICENITYLLENIDAIAITERDSLSLNGGCTEPHVSHVLSARLSSRPKGWSKETLTSFVPLLAAKGVTFNGEDSKTSEEKPDTASIHVRDYLSKGKKRYLANTLGLEDPDKVVSLPARQNKVTPLFNALRRF